MQLHSSVSLGSTALALAGALLAPGAHAQEVTPVQPGLSFSAPRFLPGDTADGMTAGQQQETDLAAGGPGFLAVWSDGRSCLDDYQGLTGSGFDVYGALLDAGGNVLLRSIVIDEGPGNQIRPHVAWNGEEWLVAWIEQDPTGVPTYDRIRAVRVATDGTVLDATPILIAEDDYFFGYYGMAMAGGGTGASGGWTIAFEGNGTGLHAVRVATDGTVATQRVITPANVTEFDITFATDEYLIVWKSTSTVPKARRLSPTLQVLGSTNLPFADQVATDGTNFLVVDTNDNVWPPALQAFLMDHSGNIVVSPFTVKTGNAVSGPSGERVAFDGTDYIVTWNTANAARVTASGVLLDPEGFPFTPVTTTFGPPALATAPGGGLQMLWHDGGGGAGNPMDAWTGRFTATGGLVDQTPASVAAPAQVEPDFARGPGGTNVIVFRSRASMDACILAQRIDDDGVALDAEPIEVASGPVQWLQTPTIDQPSVAWNGSVFMITWSDTVDVQARRMNPDGTFVDASPIVVMPGQHSAVGALGTGFLVAGSTVGTNLATGALRVARVDGVTGTVLDSPPITLSTPSIAGQYPHIVTMNGRWLVVWESVYRDPWSTTVIESTAFALVEADGSTTGELDAGLGLRPDVAVGDDRVLFVAVDDTVSGGTTNIDGRIMLFDGTFLGPGFQVSTAPEEQLAPAAAWNGTEFLVAWEDQRNAVAYFDARTDIYGTRVSRDGSVLDPAGVPLATSPQVETAPTFLSLGRTTLMATSVVRSDTSLGTFRLGLRRTRGASGPFPTLQPQTTVSSDLGYGGPGGAVLQLAGDALRVTGVPSASSTWVVAGSAPSPTPFFGGQLVPAGSTTVLSFVTDGVGRLTLPAPGADGPITLYLQAVTLDGSLPLGVGISNALRVDVRP